MVFLSTGSSPIRMPPFPVVGDVPVIMADDVYQGKLPVGQKVVVIGGGAVGCETAWHLAGEGKHVTVVEMLPEVARDLFMVNRSMLLESLYRCGVNILTETRVTQIVPGAVHVSNKQGAALLEAEAVVLAIGRQPENKLIQGAREIVHDVYVVGDCLSPRKIINAIWEAYKTARLV